MVGLRPGGYAGQLPIRPNMIAIAMPESASLDPTPIWFVNSDNWPQVRERLAEPAVRFADACGFAPKPGRIQALPDAQGRLAAVVFGESRQNEGPGDPFLSGKLATTLPAGDYRFANMPEEPELAALGFLLGLYRYERFRSDLPARPRLREVQGADLALVERQAAAICFGRDLVNAPANVLTPEALEAEAATLAAELGASFSAFRGDELIENNFPLIHAVGAAATQAPRLVDMRWGRDDAPKVTLVGKGVVFDTGGLDIKPASGMDLMKKDMGGAATALTLMRLIRDANLDICLRVLIPIVENSISAQAMRPGDILRSRKGLTVEIGNTDAEGRLILADALALAAEESPDLMLDFATLTGAARVALGPDLPPFYTDNEALAADIASAAADRRDPLWRMPLWRPYDAMLDSGAADINNAPGSPFAGSITAALFLRKFAAGAREWAHFDVYAWNPKPRAHGPLGGEIQAARAILAVLQRRYSTI